MQFFFPLYFLLGRINLGNISFSCFLFSDTSFVIDVTHSRKNRRLPAHCDFKYCDVRISDLISWYNIQYHIIRPELMIRYSIPDYQTWPHDSIFDIILSDLTSWYNIRYQNIRRYSIFDLTAFANISRISTEDFPLVSNHLPNDKITTMMMLNVTMEVQVMIYKWHDICDVIYLWW